MTRPRPGLYDEPITLALDARLAELAEELRRVEDLEPHEAAEAFGRLVYRRLVAALGSLPTDDRIGHQVCATNALLARLAELAPKAGVVGDDHLAEPARRLLAILEPASPPLEPVVPARPKTPLATSDLLVNGRHDLSLGPEVRRELASADRVDLLCSFLEWSGLRLVQDDLQELLRRRPGARADHRVPGLDPTIPSAAGLAVERGLARMLHLDDPRRLDGLRALLAPEAIPRAEGSRPGSGGAERRRRARRRRGR